MKLLLLCALTLLAKADEPVVSRWILSRPAASAELKRSLPDMHDVLVDDEFVEVRSAGISLLSLGPFRNPLSGDGGLRDLRFRVPRKPVFADGDSQRMGPGALGVFLNGVPLYNRFAEASYLGRNMWHFDTVASAMAAADPAHPMSLGVIQEMIANSPAHSPILGFALDGFPIYGPWGFANADGSGGLRRIRSGYRLRAIRERVAWADGKQLTPSQYGPAVNAEFPLGAFAEDYEYRPDAGDLDVSNGRFAVTPDYPQGTYAYFLTTGDAGRIAFPYFLIDRFKGRLASVEPREIAKAPASSTSLQFSHDGLQTGTAAEFRFAFPGTLSLEIVHERPIHLMVISRDLAEFDHIHPQWKLGNYYAVSHTFSRPGKYRLFAQFTLPGEPERTEIFDVEVTGAATAPQLHAAAAITARLIQPDRIRTGEDVTFTVELGGAPIEPYLGAWGHFVFLDRSMEHFIHAHPGDEVGAALGPRLPHIHGLSDAAAGPAPSSVKITTNFSKAGRYKLWAQFQVRGEVVVMPFFIEVTSAGGVTRTKTELPRGAIAVVVDARGFTPARIEVGATAFTLAITRSAAPNCGSQIVFPALGIKRDLPVGETTLVELPKVSGELAFACGMGMFRGMIVGVTEPQPSR